MCRVCEETALSVLGCIALIAWRRRELTAVDAVETDAEVTADAEADAATDRTWVLALLSALAGAVLIDWVWAVPIAAVWAAAILLRRTWLVAWAGVAVIAVPALIVTYIVRSESPFPGAGWPIRFEWLHPWTLLGVALLVSGSLVQERSTSSKSSRRLTLPEEPTSA